MAGVPAEILARAEFPPVEDVILPILRSALPGVDVGTLIDSGHPDMFPFVLVRAYSAIGGGGWGGDERFLESAPFSVHTFTDGVEADREGALLSEAARCALRDASLGRLVIPDVAAVIKITMTSRPRRVPDWATSTGPVQYADLPAGTTRYESIYRAAYRSRRH